MLVKKRVSKKTLLMMFSSSLLVGGLHASSAETSPDGWKGLYDKIRNSYIVNWATGSVNSVKEDANETFGKAVTKGKALLASTPLKEYVLGQEPVTVRGDFQLYAWLVPNERPETEEERKTLDNNLVSVSDIEKITGYTVLRDMVPADWYQKNKQNPPSSGQDAIVHE